jgi:tRNA pseudouridine55 synthase
MTARTARRPVHGILLLDKPLGLSSNDGLYAAEKAGHTGSLDPLATGMLPICFGAATKLCGQLLDADKRYLARGRFGQRTDTGDAEGQVVEESSAEPLTPADWQRVLAAFSGAVRQIPPMYSALKHQGQRLYELARKGQVVERTARDIHVHELRLLRAEGPDFEIDVRCSKGTYIRTLVEDIARLAGRCAHLTGLRRIETGPFLEGMHSMDELAGAAGDSDRRRLDDLLLEAGAALPHLPRLCVDEIRASRLRQGLPQRVPAAPRDGSVLVTDLSGRTLCLARVDGDGLVAPKSWLAP